MSLIASNPSKRYNQVKTVTKENRRNLRNRQQGRRKKERHLEVSKRFYIRSSDPIKRLRNLRRLAKKHFPTKDGGNFSKMINDALNRLYNLDPDTGAELDTTPTNGHGGATKKSKLVRRG